MALFQGAVVSEGHPTLATELANMGVLLQKQGDYGEARGVFPAR